METEVRKLAGNLKLKSVSEAKPIVDDYQMLTGKRSHCVNEASERVYTFENESGQALDVTFCAYNDGVVFVNIPLILCLKVLRGGCRSMI